jgi:two-component system chemotaxis response regulator CheY
MKYALVVDDSSVIRKIARRMLEELNFRVEEAEDGFQALKRCKEEFPDVIFLDWNMPELSGMDFLIELRKMPDGDKPKVIFCTTENQQDRLIRAMEAGADEYIMKPFDEHVVRDKLEQVGMILS